MPDKTIVCKDCQKPFVFTEAMQVKLQELVAEKKIETYNEPKRCRPCREAKKQSFKSQGN